MSGRVEEIGVSVGGLASLGGEVPDEGMDRYAVVYSVSLFAAWMASPRAAIAFMV